MGKVFERMVNDRLAWWAEKERKFHPSQNGFRKGRSCANNLAYLSSFIKLVIYNFEHTVAALLDVKSTYDNVNYELLVRKLEDLGCPFRITKVINEWFKHRIESFVLSEVDKTIKRDIYV